MSAEDTIQREFYAPWPDLGVKFSQQLNEIREDIAALAPIVRGVGLDSDGNFNTLDGVEQCVMQALEIGKQDFHNKFRIHYNKDDDLFEIAYNNRTTGNPNWYTMWWIDDDGHVTQQNTPTTASNLGSGQGVFKQKVGVDLEFKSIGVTTPLTISSTGTDITVSGSALVSTYSSDRPAAPSGDANTGVEIILSDTGKVGNDLPFKALKAGPNVVIRNLLGTAIEIESTAQVVEFYGIHVGHSEPGTSYNEVHNLLFNREDFYLTQQSTHPSNKTVIVNSISDPFNSSDYVAVIGDDMTGALSMYDGTQSLPAISFTSETDTGIRRRAANDLALVVSGADKLRLQDSLLLSSVPVQVTSSASAATPDFAFFPDTDTGIFQNASGDASLAFATNGIRAGYFSGTNQNLILDSKLEARSIESGYGVFYTQVISDKFLARRNGSVTNAAFGWEAEPDTGLFRSTTDTIVMATNGVARMTTNTASHTSTLPIYVAAGAVGTPQYSFTDQTNSGLYKGVDNGTTEHTVDMAVNGVQCAVFRWGTGGLPQFKSLGPIWLPDGDSSLPALTFTTDKTIGMYYDGADKISFVAAGYANLLDINGNTGYVEIQSSANGFISPRVYAKNTTGALVQIQNTSGPNTNFWQIQAPVTTGAIYPLEITCTTPAITMPIRLNSPVSLFTTCPNIDDTEAWVLCYAGTDAGHGMGTLDVTFNAGSTSSSLRSFDSYLNVTNNQTGQMIVQGYRAVNQVRNNIAGVPSVQGYIGFNSVLLSTIVAAGDQPIPPVSFQSAYSFKCSALGVAHTDTTTYYPKSLNMTPIFETGSGTTPTVSCALAEGITSNYRLSNAAGGSTTVTTYTDFRVKALTKSGVGTETATTRNFIQLDDETQTTNLNGILSVITSGANKKFINHTGSAASLHTGDFVVTDEAYAASWDNNYAVPTKNSIYDKIETLVTDVEASPGFYGVVFRESETGGYVKRTDTLTFDSAYFYVSSGGDNHPVVSFIPSGITGEANTASNQGAGAGVFLQKTGVDLEFKSLKSKDSTVSVTNDANEIFFSATGTFYTPVSIEGASPSLTVGSGASTDSIVEFFDSGSLAYTMGWDESANSFKITSGPMDDTNDEIVITPDLVTVSKKLSARSIESGYGVFYSSLRADQFLVTTGRGASSGDVGFGWVEEWEAGYKFPGSYTGLYRYAQYTPAMSAGDNLVQRWGSDVSEMYKQFAIVANSDATEPGLILNSADTDTGLWMATADPDKINFTTGGTNRGFFSSTGLTVKKLNAGVVESGYGYFYTQTVSDRFIANRRGEMHASLSQPQFCFSNAVTGTGVDSGLGYNSDGQYPYMAVDGGWQQFWTTAYTGIRVQSRGYWEGLTTPTYSWQNDADTGMTRVTGDVNTIRFATGGALAGTFDGKGDFYVPNGGIFTNLARVNDSTYAASWDGDFTVPTKNAIYDKINTTGTITFKESQSGGHAQLAPKVAFDSTHFYLSTGGDGNPLVSLQDDRYMMIQILTPAILNGAVWTNMPLAVTQLFGTSMNRFWVNLTKFTEWRLTSGSHTVAGAANSKVGVLFSVDNTLADAGLDNNTAGALSTATVSLTPTGIQRTGWNTIHSALRGEGVVSVWGSGGDGIIDPTLKPIYIEFR